MLFSQGEIRFAIESAFRFYCFKRISCLLVCIHSLVLIQAVPFSYGAENLKETTVPVRVRMISPVPGTLVFSKKPVIEFQINVPYEAPSLYVALDNTDVSEIVEFTDDGFTFKPIQVLPAGDHSLYITLTAQNGARVEKEFFFKTRHSKMFETAYSKNSVSGGYTAVLKKYQDAKDKEMSDWTTEANITTENYVQEGAWNMNLTANGRYHDQELPLQEPVDDNFELVDFLFKSRYQKNRYQVETAVGDIVVDESRNTVSNLARKGGKIAGEYGAAGVAGFAVKSEHVYGTPDNMGLGYDRDDHILGVSGDVDLFTERANIKTVYVSGGTEPDTESFGTWSETGGTKGDVRAIVLATDFFQNKLATLFEYDRSDYDDDTSDNSGSEKDNAYYLRAGGTVKNFSYSAEYEHTGPDYHVPGNTAIQSDWEGYTFRGDLSLENHSFGGRYSEYNDDVDRDSIYGRTEYTDYMVNYGLNILKSAPMTFSFARSIQENRISDVDNYTDTYTSTVSYTKDRYNLFFSPSYSVTNDQTDVDYDSSNLSLNLSGSYYKENFSIQPSYGFNRYKDLTTDEYMDTDTYGLSFLIPISTNVSISDTGYYSRMTASDDSVDQDSFYNDLQVTYSHPGRIRGIFSPSASLTLSYEKTKDRVAGTETEETILYLTLSGDLEMSF